MLKPVELSALSENVFDLLGKRWTLITAGTPEHCNTMTASWGGLGVLWNKKVATIYIRPQRYTYEFVENSDYFTLSFFDEGYREALNLCGTKSGRDMDKIATCNLTVQAGAGNAPYFQEANLVLVCKKLYAQDMDPQCFVEPALEKNYPNKDYHRIYVGEVMEAYQG